MYEYTTDYCDNEEDLRNLLNNYAGRGWRAISTTVYSIVDHKGSFPRVLVVFEKRDYIVKKQLKQILSLFNSHPYQIEKGIYQIGSANRLEMDYNLENVRWSHEDQKYICEKKEEK